MLSHGAAPALVLPIEVQAQTQYQIFEVKPEGQPTQSKSALTTTYNLAFRRPLSPHVKLQSFLTMNSSEHSDQIGRQSNRNLVLNLLSQERTYTLTGSVDRSDHHSATALLGAPSISDGTTTNYNLNFVWREPALPVMNLQYRNSKSDVTSGLTSSTYSTATWLTGTFYEYRPFRLTYDRQQQDYNFSGRSTSTSSTTTRSRMGLNFEQRLLEGLNFTADFGKDSSSTENSGISSSLSGTSSVFRLTATPTRSVLINLDRSFYTSDQSTRTFSTTTDSDTTGISLRSEIVPGLSFGVSSLTSDQKSSVGQSENKSLSASLGAVLASDTFASLGWSRSSYHSMPGELAAEQKSSYISLRTPLRFDTDVTFDLGWTDSENRPVITGYRGKYAGVNIRNRSRSDASYGLGYRWNVLNLRGTQTGKQRTQSIDCDLAWTPASSLGINARVSYYVTSGNTISQYISPTIDIRWEPSSQSNLVLRYDFNRSEQWDPLQAAVLGQSARGLSARFSYRIDRRSSFDITYDYQSASTGGLDFQRVIRAYFRIRL